MKSNKERRNKEVDYQVYRLPFLFQVSNSGDVYGICFRFLLKIFFSLMDHLAAIRDLGGSQILEVIAGRRRTKGIC